MNKDFEQISTTEDEEEACWVLWQRETEAETPVVEAEIGIEALCVEVKL